MWFEAAGICLNIEEKSNLNVSLFDVGCIPKLCILCIIDSTTFFIWQYLRSLYALAAYVFWGALDERMSLFGAWSVPNIFDAAARTGESMLSFLFSSATNGCRRHSNENNEIKRLRLPCGMQWHWENVCVCAIQFGRYSPCYSRRSPPLRAHIKISRFVRTSNVEWHRRRLFPFNRKPLSIVRTWHEVRTTENPTKLADDAQSSRRAVSSPKHFLLRQSWMTLFSLQSSVAASKVSVCSVSDRKINV